MPDFWYAQSLRSLAASWSKRLFCLLLIADLKVCATKKKTSLFEAGH